MGVYGTPFQVILETWGHHLLWKACKNRTQGPKQGPEAGARNASSLWFLVCGCEGAPGWPQVPFLVPPGGSKGDPRAPGFDK